MVTITKSKDLLRIEAEVVLAKEHLNSGCSVNALIHDFAFSKGSVELAQSESPDIDAYWENNYGYLRFIEGYKIID